MADGAIYFLGVDGGGSGCRARVTDACGQILGTGVAGPANLRLGAEASWAALMAAAQASMGQADLHPQRHQIRAAIGVAGVGRLGATATLLSMPHPFASIKVVSDQQTACIGAHGGRDGGIVIAGTGSAAYGRSGEREVRFGGFGFPVSDEGSGAWIGLEALRLVLRAFDGRQPRSDLFNSIMPLFDNDPYRIVEWMERASATDYAALAPNILASAGSGDPAAREIAQRAAKQICGLIEALNDHGIASVALLGGLSASLRAWMPDASRAGIVTPDGDAIDGALLLAGLANNARRSIQ